MVDMYNIVLRRFSQRLAISSKQTSTRRLVFKATTATAVNFTAAIGGRGPGMKLIVGTRCGTELWFVVSCEAEGSLLLIASAC